MRKEHHRPAFMQIFYVFSVNFPSQQLIASQLWFVKCSFYQKKKYNAKKGLKSDTKRSHLRTKITKMSLLNLFKVFSAECRSALATLVPPPLSVVHSLTGGSPPPQPHLPVPVYQLFFQRWLPWWVRLLPHRCRCRGVSGRPLQRGGLLIFFSARSEGPLN